MKSKYWSDMYILNTNSDTQMDTFIISKEPPISSDNDKVTFEHITEKYYDEVSDFIKKYNRMSTGNTTLLEVSDLERYLKLPNTSLLMRNEHKLMGTILSLELPILNRFASNEELIIHGCTTFLNVHSAIRGFGLGMNLIRKLIEIGYKKNIYCDYHMVPMKIGENSIPISSWYRPINLKRCVKLGFLYPDYDNEKLKRKLKLRYNTILPKGYSYRLVSDINLKVSHEYYLSTIKDKIFAFYPDLHLWIKWIMSFPTYLIYEDQLIIGIVSINHLSCFIETTGEKGKVLFPIICNGDINKMLPVILNIGSKHNYDVMYVYQYGLIKTSDLEQIKCIKTATDVWFSLYNNSIKLKQEDIFVPLL